MTPRRSAAWHVPVRVEDVPLGGQRFELAADDAVRTAVAQTAGLAGLPHLTATFDVSRRGRDGLRVTGVVAAIVCQTCVVTLEPIENRLEEAVDITFLPEAASGRAVVAAEALADVADVAQEPPERLVNGTVDLGAVAIEFLMLGIDPYPRKAGAVFSAPASGEAVSNPFAALAAIKKRAE